MADNVTATTCGSVLLLLLAACGTARAQQAAATPPGTDFLIGGDISMLTRIEQCGGVFRRAGKPADMIRILMAHGCNGFRLRLFVNPNHKNAVVNDLPYTRALARRIKSAGGKLLLNFHYSDTWADPAHQTKPAAWRPLAFPALVKKVEDYTATAVADLRKADALPDMVQIGNEITPGMLWPDGRIGGKYNTDEQWDKLAELLKAGIRGVRRGQPPGANVRIMLHTDGGGSWGRTKWLFDGVTARDVPFDVIGLSYYPWWHGRMEDLATNLRNTARKYHKDIIVVETAYPYTNAKWWTKQKNMAWPISKEGQRAFLQALVETVAQTPAGRGKGVMWWYPEAIPAKGLKIWNGGATALFDANGNVLPAAAALRPRPKPGKAPTPPPASPS